LEKLKDNINLIIYVLIMILITIVMFYFINQKEGFHEDEIFSYGASNSSLGNTFLTYARTDDIDLILKDNNPIKLIKNLIYYRILHPDKYLELEREHSSIWRTRADAIEYTQIDNLSEAVNFFDVYWATSKDVHPPLFYFAVHIISILFWGSFSKYIIFYVNLICFICTCIILRKIFLKLNKPHLIIPNLILYGFSVGAISTVMFQRMYMMLTLFTIYFLYINLKIYYNNFELNKRLKIELCCVTVLGFLTQYYFCFYAAFLALIMIIILLKRKEKSKAISYFLQYVRAGIIGVVLFVPSIYHIFFSYRGTSGNGSGLTFLESLKSFIKNTFLAYSFSEIVGYIVLFILFILFIIKFIKSKQKELYILLSVPLILYFIMVVKMSPYLSVRYVMNILPIISIIVIFLLDDFAINKNKSQIFLIVLATILSIYGLYTNPIKFLYKGYNKYLEIANEYENNRFVLVCTSEFPHLQDLPEFQIYKESMIVEPENLEHLSEFKEFEEDDEIIVGIKNWLNKKPEDIIKEIIKYTGYTDYEFLYDSVKSSRETIYRVYR